VKLLAHRRSLFIGGGVVVALAGLAAAGIFIYLLLQPIPSKVLNQANFGIWYPTTKSLELKIDRSSIKYTQASSDKLVTFTARNPTNTLTFTEQALPESFTDVPQAYDKLIERLRGYTSFDTVNGTVALTRPEELKGAQTAIMQSRGTLVFIKPSKDLSADDWRLVINNLGFAH
jgi:hypothetical protein